MFVFLIEGFFVHFSCLFLLIIVKLCFRLRKFCLLLFIERAVLALHDVSDGGLLTCLLEMCVAGWGGASVDVPPPPAPPSTATDKAPPTLAALFSEEVG